PPARSFFSGGRPHTRFSRDWSSDVCSSDLVGPDRNVWYTKGATLGRVTPDGVIREFPVGERSRAVGLTAGSDREPPVRLVNRLWFADGGANRLAYLRFR